MRLDKYLSDAGIGSRSEVKKIIAKGQVTINDLIVKDSKINILTTDVIRVLGTIVTYEELVYYMLNKPKGVVSASKDEVVQTTRQLITDYKKDDLFNVGRLDKDTEGILLLTNDGLLSHQLLSPKYHVEKTYLVDFRGDFLETYIAYFETGLTLKDGTVCRPAKIELINDHQAFLTISEGKYHQVKRMFGALNMGVTRLKRVSFGPLQLDSNLVSGAYRKLTPLEIQELRAVILKK